MRSVPATLICAVLFTLNAVQPAAALITGGTGNDPVRDPGWPVGAADVFNAKSRIAWWEGPPFGGGEWHAEYRGDARAFNELLVQFAKIETPRKRIYVHDGEGRSFWLNPNNEPGKRSDAATDWVFVIWNPDNYKRLQSLPPDLSRNITAGDPPPPRIDVYTGGRIRWADVKVPEGVDVVDERLEAHGFHVTDGVVIEGTIHDLANGKPLQSARVQLQRYDSQEQGGYRYTTVATAEADANGHYVLKSLPAGQHQVLAIADGYATRILGYASVDAQPRWQALSGGLAKAAAVAGRVTDDAGKPLPDVTVILRNVVARGDSRYDMATPSQAKSDGDGKFRFEGVPVGTAAVSVHKQGYCRPGLGEKIELPAEDVQLSMIKAAALKVTVDFTATARPEGYIVEVNPEGGAVVGSWGASSNLNAEGVVAYDQIPPGKYVVTGRPNPGREADRAGPVTVDLKSGELTQVTLRAR